MRLKFPNHMQDMIQYRGLSVDDVRLAIMDPDFTEETFQGRTKVCKELETGKFIKVMYYKDGFKNTQDFIVVTAYYTSNC